MMHGTLAHSGVTPPLRVAIAHDVAKREADALAVRRLLCDIYVVWHHAQLTHPLVPSTSLRCAAWAARW
jgi:hypothetical protein